MTPAISPPPSEVKLNPRQKRLLVVLADWQSSDLPTLNKLAPLIGVAGESSVRRVLEALLELGYIERVSLGTGFPSLPKITRKGSAYIAQHLRPTEELGDISTLRRSKRSVMPQVPLPCGPLAEAVEEVRYIDTPFDDYREGDYLGTARGWSMFDSETGRGIRAGDKCHLRPNVAAETGQIVHAEYMRQDGVHECTLKVFSINEATGLVTLWALNPDRREYPDIVLPEDEVLIRGVLLDVISVVGRYSRK